MTIDIKGVKFTPNCKYICVPITAGTLADLKRHLSSIVAKKPDVIEWRADYFKEIDQFDKAMNLFKTEASHIPLIFTLRDVTEGGIIAHSEAERITFLESIADSGFFDFIDIEWFAPKALIERAKILRLDKGFKLILSNHDFEKTPEQSDIVSRLEQMKHSGADIVKVAYYANSERDALSLLEASLIAGESNQIPQIVLSMGPLGIITRIFGYQYGSVLSYAVGINSSAEGQLPIEALREFWKYLQ